MKAKDKHKLKVSNPPPKSLFYANKTSIRGGLAKTRDGIAIAFFVVAMVFFTIFSILSVIDNKDKEENEKKTTPTQRFKELIFKPFM